MTEVGWEEVERDSIGGHHNASAYCLIYVQSAKLKDPGEQSVKCLNIFFM